MTRHSTRSLKLSVPGSQGLLDARLDIPDIPAPKAFIIMSHCFTCTKETLTTARISRGLAQQGYAVLRFDFTGLGNSQGQFAESNFTSMVRDILQVAHYLEQHYTPPAALIGHSMGGTAALAASCELVQCKTVVTVASPSKPSHVLHHFGKAMSALESGQDAEIMVAGTAYPVKPQFIHDVRQYNLPLQMQSCDKPIMAVRAGHDSLVNAEDVLEILAYTSGETCLLDIEQADHLFSDRTDTDKVISEIGHWLDRQCPHQS